MSLAHCRKQLALALSSLDSEPVPCYDSIVGYEMLPVVAQEAGAHVHDQHEEFADAQGHYMDEDDCDTLALGAMENGAADLCEADSHDGAH